MRMLRLKIEGAAELNENVGHIDYTSFMAV